MCCLTRRVPLLDADPCRTPEQDAELQSMMCVWTTLRPDDAPKKTAIIVSVTELSTILNTTSCTDVHGVRGPSPDCRRPNEGDTALFLRLRDYETYRRIRIVSIYQIFKVTVSSTAYVLPRRTSHYSHAPTRASVSSSSCFFLVCVAIHSDSQPHGSHRTAVASGRFWRCSWMPGRARATSQ